MNEILNNWQQVLEMLPKDLEESAKRYGAFQRARGVPDAQTLLRLVLVYCTTPLSFRQTVSWAKGLGIAELTDVSFIERMQRCESWLYYLLQQSFGQSLPKNQSKREVHLVDATSVVAPDKSVWKLHVVYEAQSQTIQQIVLGDARVSEHFRNIQAEANILYLADRGYQHPKGIEGLLEAHAQVLCRIKAKGYLQHADSQKVVEVAVSRGRVIIAPIPPEKHERIKKRIQRKASRNQRTMRADTLQSNEFLFLFCSDPTLSPQEAVALYRWRWQIELLFKRLKGLQGLDEMAVKSPPLVRVYLLCHALVALLAQHLKQTLEKAFPPEAMEAAIALAALAVPLSGTEPGLDALPA